MAYWDADIDFISTVTVLIKDIEKSILVDTLNIQSSVSNRTDCNFDMIVDSKEDIKLGNHVDIFAWSNQIEQLYLFAGRIKNIKIKPVTIGGELIANINATDYNHVLDRILVSEEYVNKSIYYIVNDIYEKYLIDEWVAIYTYPGTDAIIEKAVFSYISIADCFKYLCDETAYNYIVAVDGWIDFFYRDDLTTQDIELSHIIDIDIEYNLDGYRNRQYVKGGYDETTVTNEVLTPQPDGNTTTFFSRYPVGTIPTVKVNSVTVSDSSVGIDGIDSDKWFYWNKNVNKLSQNVELLPTLSSGTVSMDYKGLVKILIESDNVEGQTEMADNETSESVWGSGVYTDIEEVTSIQTRNEAINYANGLLYKYNKIPEVINLKTWCHRNLGRTVFVNYPQLTDDQLMFIEGVTTYLEGGRLRFNYKLLNGESLGNWTEFFRKVYKQGQDMLINDDLSLIKLQQQSENWDICSEYDISIFDLVYISNTTYVSEYLTLNRVIYGKQFYPIFVSNDTYISENTPICIISDNTIIVKDT